MLPEWLKHGIWRLRVYMIRTLYKSLYIFVNCKMKLQEDYQSMVENLYSMTSNFIDMVHVWMETQHLTWGGIILTAKLSNDCYATPNKKVLKRGLWESQQVFSNFSTIWIKYADVLVIYVKL